MLPPTTRPFTKNIGLTQPVLHVVRDLIRQIKVSDEVRNPRALENLTPEELRCVWDSDVTPTLVNADMPAHLAVFALELLTDRIDRLVRKHEYAFEEARAHAEHYAGDTTYGMF